MEINGIGYDDFDYPKHKTSFASITIKPRPAFSTSCCRRLFATQLASAKHIAWRTIMDKYLYYDSGQDKLSGIKHAAGLDCSCDFDSEYGKGSDACDLHDRRTGYFRRLHKKLTQIIIRENERKMT
jgi:hypothetical protein